MWLLCNLLSNKFWQQPLLCDCVFLEPGTQFYLVYQIHLWLWPSSLIFLPLIAICPWFLSPLGEIVLKRSPQSKEPVPDQVKWKQKRAGARPRVRTRAASVSRSKQKPELEPGSELKPDPEEASGKWNTGVGLPVAKQVLVARQVFRTQRRNKKNVRCNPAISLHILYLYLELPTPMYFFNTHHQFSRSAQYCIFFCPIFLSLSF